MGKIKFVDLFCGIGGFRLALEARGAECVFSSDINKHARESYKQNFGELPSGDITKIEAEDIPAHDVLTGGFPCQSFSIAGSKKGVNDDRGQLFYEIIRIARHHRPRIVLLENVPHILEIDDGMVLEEFTTAWNAAGYRVTYHLLNSSNYAVPQARQRVYFAIIRNDVALKSYRPPVAKDKIYICEILDEAANADPKLRVPETHGLSSPRAQRARQVRGHYRYKLELFVEHADGTIRLGDIGLGDKVYSQSYRIFSIHGHSPTIQTFNNEYFNVNGTVRALSILELKRVAGFPDDHIVSAGRKGIAELGNAVIPQMAGLVYDSIIPDTDEAYKEFSQATSRIAPVVRPGVRRCSANTTSTETPAEVTASHGSEVSNE